MNRLTQLFQTRQSNLLSVYLTAGFPHLEDTPRLIQYLQQAGCDMIEIGIPFSGPLADGETIQHSSTQALKNGMNLKLLFKQLKDIRKTVDIPLLLMGYLNPVIHYGFKRFLSDAQAVGIDGLILPDLPIEEQIQKYSRDFKRSRISFVPLAAPSTPLKRLKKIDSAASGFIYLLSSSSTTGKAVDKTARDFFLKVREEKLQHQTMIGFGIRSRRDFLYAAERSAGAVIGSEFIKTIAAAGNLKEAVFEFVKRIKGIR